MIHHWSGIGQVIKGHWLPPDMMLGESSIRKTSCLNACKTIPTPELHSIIHVFNQSQPYTLATKHLYCVNLHSCLLYLSFSYHFSIVRNLQPTSTMVLTITSNHPVKGFPHEDSTPLNFIVHHYHKVSRLWEEIPLIGRTLKLCSVSMVIHFCQDLSVEVNVHNTFHLNSHLN